MVSLTPAEVYRVLLLRDPEFGVDSRQYRTLARMDPALLVRSIMNSQEFRSRWTKGNDVAPDLRVMTDAPGLRYWFRLRDKAIGRQIAQNKYEPRITALVKRLATPGSTVLDIGANLGYFSVLMGSQGCKVHAFEPFPDNFDLLTRNIRENRLDADVIAHEMAVHRETKSGKLYFRTDDQNDNFGSMFTSAIRQDQHLASIDVRYARVDEVLAGEGQISFVKMDVEGAEIYALQGMAEILKRDRPPLIVELNEYALSTANGHTPEELLNVIEDFGYRVFDAETGEPYKLPHNRERYVFANIYCAGAQDPTIFTK